jgi:hypothetical protein
MILFPPPICRQGVNLKKPHPLFTKYPPPILEMSPRVPWMVLLALGR